MNIREFKKGDEIVRVKAAKMLNNPVSELDFFGMNLRSPMSGGDRSYLGNKMIFIGIANGMIYAENNDTFHAKVLNKTRMELALDLWDEGWEFWVDPSTLIDTDYTKKDEGIKTELSADSVNSLIREATKRKDWDEVDRLLEIRNNL